MASGAGGRAAQRHGAAALGPVHRRRPASGRPVAARRLQSFHLDSAGRSAGCGGTPPFGMDPLVVRAAAHIRRMVRVRLPALARGKPRGQHHRRGVLRGGGFRGDHQLAADRGGRDLAAAGLSVLSAQPARRASDCRRHPGRRISGPFGARRTPRRAGLCVARDRGAWHRRAGPRPDPLELGRAANLHRVRGGGVRRRGAASARGGIRPLLAALGERRPSGGLAVPQFPTPYTRTWDGVPRI